MAGADIENSAMLDFMGDRMMTAAPTSGVAGFNWNGWRVWIGIGGGFHRIVAYCLSGSSVRCPFVTQIVLRMKVNGSGLDGGVAKIFLDEADIVARVGLVRG